MQIGDDRREFGSFFHWFPYEESTPVLQPWSGNGVSYGCGRDALRSLLQLGSTTRGWKRLWVPSYFCQTVVRTFIASGLEVCLYEHAPERPVRLDRLDTRPGDAILRQNLFGLHSAPSVDAIDRSNVEIIDDHTHDPWSDWAWQSDADWCTASLRKLLPLPDGGVLWSPRNHQLPQQPAVTPERRVASLERMSAMVLKAKYLSGHSIDREMYRRLAVAGEEHLAAGEISGMPEWTENLLRCFPVQVWRRQGMENWSVVADVLGNVSWLRLLRPEDSSRMCSFAGIVRFDSAEKRDSIQAHLASRNVFLPVLWPMSNPATGEVPEEQILFSRSMLCIPCDMRYDRDTVHQVAALIREAGEAVDCGSEDRAALSRQVPTAS